MTVLGAINVGTFCFALGAFPEIGLQDNLVHRAVFVAIITGGMAHLFVDNGFTAA